MNRGSYSSGWSQVRVIDGSSLTQKHLKCDDGLATFSITFQIGKYEKNVSREIVEQNRNNNFQSTFLKIWRWSNMFVFKCNTKCISIPVIGLHCHDLVETEVLGGVAIFTQMI